jgi:PncC family amidohydrolase
MERIVARTLTRRRLTLAVAESCTGGLIASSLTDIPGSSRFFLGGIVAYANEVKTRLLGVEAKTLELHGAVSKDVALEMARHVRRLTGAHTAIGITGVLGPAGGTDLKPLGTVFVAIAFCHGAYYRKLRLKGPRLQKKRRAKNAALTFLLECLQ